MLKFHCEKALLQGAAAAASRAVSPKSSVPAMEGLLLRSEDGLTITGYNGSMGIRAAVPALAEAPGETVLNARLFGDIIRRMPDGMISVTVEESGMAHLKCGDAEFHIMGLDARDFPELPVVEGEESLTLRQGLFRRMIEETTFSVSTNEARPVHTGALFETAGLEVTMVAIDGFRLALRREKAESVDGSGFSFVAPANALNEAKNACADSDAPAVVTLGKQHILFEIGDIQLISRRLEGEFLDYRRAVPAENPIHLTAGTRELVNSIDRVSVVISEKMKSPVRCRFEEGRVLLSTATGNGDARDICPLDGDGGGLEIGFNNRYLMEALRYAPAEQVQLRLHTSVAPVVIVPLPDDKDSYLESGKEKFLYMVLPVRLRA